MKKKTRSVCTEKGGKEDHGKYIANQPDTLQKMTNSLLVNVDIPIDTKRLVRISLYPCKIDHGE